MKEKSTQAQEMTAAAVQKREKIPVRVLVECALLIAIATVLSLLKFDLPFGGGVTVVSMLPIILIGHRHGATKGILSAEVYSVIQLFLGMDNLKYAKTPAMILGILFLDYLLAYSVIGLSGFFDWIFGKSRKSLFIGILVTFTLRFVCHWISGAWIWGSWMPEKFMGMKMASPWVYSALYNGWYMFVELVLTEFVAMLLYKPLGKFFRGEDLKKAK